jgi:hypothetical protein
MLTRIWSGLPARLAQCIGARHRLVCVATGAPRRPVLAPTLSGSGLLELPVSVRESLGPRLGPSRSCGRRTTGRRRATGPDDCGASPGRNAAARIDVSYSFRPLGSLLRPPGRTMTPRAGARLRARLDGRVTARFSAEAKPRRGLGRGHEPAHALAAGAVTAPVQARGRWSGGRAPKPQASGRETRARFPFNPAISCGAPSKSGAATFIAPLNGGARLRARAHDSRAVAPEPDLQERRRDVGRASVRAERARHGGLLGRSRPARPRPA